MLRIVAVSTVSHMMFARPFFIYLWLTVKVAVTPDTSVCAVNVIVAKSFSSVAVMITLDETELYRVPSFVYEIFVTLHPVTLAVTI